MNKNLTVLLVALCCVAGVVDAPAQLALDNTFSGDGKVNTPIGNDPVFVNGALVQNDNKILISASTAPNQNNTAPVLLRYNTDGSLDNTFQSAGYKIYNLNLTNHVFPGKPALSLSGMIYLPIGTSGGQQGFMVMLVDQNGNVQNSFGTNGLAKIPVATDAQALYAVVQPDGKVVIGGKCFNLSPNTHEGYFIARFNTDGTPDNTFNSTGYIIQPLNNSLAVFPGELLIDIQGNLYLIGSSMQNYKMVGTIMSVNSSGQLRNNFNGNGVFYYQENDKQIYLNGAVYNAALNTILIAGTSVDTSNQSSGLALMINENGQFVNTFDGDGKLQFTAGNNTLLNDVAFAPGGKYILGGYITPDHAARDLLLCRINPDGSFDNSFNGSGFYTLDWGYFCSAEEVLTQYDGKTVAVVEYKSTLSSGNEVGAVRLNNPVTGISQPEESALELYPNPVSDIIHVYASGRAHVVITDLAGREQYASPAEMGWNTIPTDGLLSGAYVFRLIAESGIRTKTIFKP
ncbi:MAG: T9SS type A sorting domain-containing protein [Chitinophagales bacterium]|nr:T9SS type A sorting domain-containing protein [Chitinophagales bacterium]